MRQDRDSLYHSNVHAIIARVHNLTTTVRRRSESLQRDLLAIRGRLDIAAERLESARRQGEEIDAELTQLRRNMDALRRRRRLPEVSSE